MCSISYLSEKYKFKRRFFKILHAGQGYGETAMLLPCAYIKCCVILLVSIKFLSVSSLPINCISKMKPRETLA